MMAQLKTIGAFIENSGIDMAWVESDIYGPSTVKQILEGNHVKRAEAAHPVTLQSLFNLYQETFLSEVADECKEHLMKLANELEDACSRLEKGEVEEVHNRMIHAVEPMDIMKKMDEFDERHANNPMFKVFRHYMAMVLEMMFIRPFAPPTGSYTYKPLRSLPSISSLMTASIMQG